MMMMMMMMIYIYIYFLSCRLPHPAWGCSCEAVLCTTEMMRPKESELAKLTDFQIRGLVGLLGFFGSLKGYIKSELPAVFLAALDDHCEGEMPDHVWRIGKTRTDKDSLVSLC